MRWSHCDCARCVTRHDAHGPRNEFHVIRETNAGTIEGFHGRDFVIAGRFSEANCTLLTLMTRWRIWGGSSSWHCRWVWSGRVQNHLDIVCGYSSRTSMCMSTSSWIRWRQSVFHLSWTCAHQSRIRAYLAISTYEFTRTSAMSSRSRRI